jgi:hypothetical protein
VKTDIPSEVVFTSKYLESFALTDEDVQIVCTRSTPPDADLFEWPKNSYARAEDNKRKHYEL